MLLSLNKLTASSVMQSGLVPQPAAANTLQNASVALHLAPDVLHISPDTLHSLLGGVSVTAQDDDTGPGLPLAGSQNGSLFSDRFDAGLQWFLPGYALAADPDPRFGFAAVQESQDVAGNPFNTAQLTFGVIKVTPPDAGAALAQPGARVQEITAAILAAQLAVGYKDTDGTDQTATFAGVLTPQDDGTFQAVFVGLTDKKVIAAYESLIQTGSATLTVTHTYAVWQSHRRFVPPPPRPLPPRPGPFPAHPLEQVSAAPLARLDESASPGMRNAAMQDLHIGQPFIQIASHDNVDAAADDLLPPIFFTQERAQAVVTLPAGAKYADGVYLARYTVASQGHTRPILNADDLLKFNISRSEYREYTELGDISERYPSIRGLYLGQVSRILVAVPMFYGITRGSGGCGALCQALVDSSAQSLSGCRFHLVFTLAPAIDPVEFVELGQELAARPDVHDCALALPSGLDGRVASSLSTPFLSAFAYADGAAPHTLLLSVEIADGASPAVAGVNLFLRQLGVPAATPLFGQVGLRLDDDFAPNVLTSVVLNLHTTAGTDDVAMTLSADGLSASVVNHSPFPLQLSRCVAFGPQGLQPAVPLDLTLAAGADVPLPLPPGPLISGAVVARALALPPLLTHDDVSDHLAFQTLDVQQVQYTLGLNGTGVSFAALGITQIVAQISFDALPTLAIASLTLLPERQVDSVHVVVPVEYALTRLASTLTLSVTGGDAARVAPQVTLTNDFLENPIFIITGDALAPVVAPVLPAQL